jgi:hypothetical protein
VKYAAYFITSKRGLNVILFVVYSGRIITGASLNGKIEINNSKGVAEGAFISGENLRRMRQSTSDKNVIATVGNEHPLKLWDLNTITLSKQSLFAFVAVDVF